jgi:hypothetical protein
MEPVEIRTEPDHPVGFGRKNAWIAVKGVETSALADALALRDIQPANWCSGVAAAYAYPSDLIFVTPQVDGWVLAVGPLLDPGATDKLPRWRQMMSRISSLHGEAWIFATHRIVNYTAWGCYRDGMERRLFAHADELIINIGDAFPEEVELIENLPDPSSAEAQEEGYWEREDLRSPDEDDVLRLAGVWSIDPSDLDSANYPVGVGVVGRFIP